jgi:lipopolysaccharide/colanic/teichoic acid biosynthesis glycosyltransferase
MRRRNPYPLWKRVIDIAGASAGLILLSPVLLLIAAVIKVVSPGPALLRQRRIGRHGKVFPLWKFRTMRPDADSRLHQEHLNKLISMDIPMTKLDVHNDARVFPFGKIIRRYCLDELPQLINVLRGEMSLVGPRPCLPYEAAQCKAWQTRRFDAVPGITGLWQVSGKNKTTFTEMIRLDIAYASRISFWTDMRILLKTIPSILADAGDASGTDGRSRSGSSQRVAIRKSA